MEPILLSDASLRLGGILLLATTTIAFGGTFVLRVVRGREAAILMLAGFFLSVVGRGVERPNRLIALVWVGAALLTASVATLGVALLRV